MTDSLRDVTILVPAQALRARSRRVSTAASTWCASSAPTPALVSGDVAGKVRGVAGMTAINAAFIDALPKLEIIANMGVGYDAVDARHAGTRGVMVTNTPDVLTEEVADTALGLLINAVRELPRAETMAAARALGEGGRLSADPGHAARPPRRHFRHGPHRHRDRQAARSVRAAGRLPQPTPGRGRALRLSSDAARAWPHAVDTLISVAPGGAATEKAVNAEVLAALGPNGVFVNIGRGSTVDEEALIAALANGTIRAAGLDVFADEPHVPQALIDLPNASLLPHVGSASVHTRNAMADLVVDNLIAWFSGKGR